MTRKRISWVRSGLISVGMVFVGIGISRGEPATVLMKAVNICLECIGIG